jgi:serine/threonine protein kinase
VGSDPYLAPEVYDLPKYDPQPADVWSIAIIYCCMTLRRFPWKAPRLSDNSYKLFVSEPNDGPRAKSLSDLPNAANKDGSEKTHHHHHHHQEHPPPHSDPQSRSDEHAKNASASGNQQAQSTQTPSQSIKGPWRLLRLLPRETRHIIGRMLEIDPNKRATLEEILDDPWISQSAVCRQEEGGAVIRAPGHEHHLEPGSGASDPSKSSKGKEAEHSARKI